MRSGQAPKQGDAANQNKQQYELNQLTGASTSDSTAAQRKKYMTLNGGDSSRPQPYNYSAQIKNNQPEILSIGINPFIIVQNVQDVARWTIGMIDTGQNQYGDNMTMGDRFYFQSGTCDREKSVPACQGKPRHIIVDNIPTHTVPCSNPTIPSDPKSAKAPTGLLSGVIQDAIHLNPFEMIASATGKGSIVNDACVERTVKVGEMNPTQGPGENGFQPLEINGVREPVFQTVCAPREQPLICSLASDGESGCIKYVPSMVQNTIEYNKTIQDTILNATVSTSVTLNNVDQIAPMSLNANDALWRRIVSIINTDVFAFQVQKQHPSFPLPQSKNFCLVNKVKCKNNTFLYKWYANHYIPNLNKASFQVEWEVYQPSSGQPVVLGANIIGNSYHQWMNEPNGYNVLQEGFDIDHTMVLEPQEHSTLAHRHGNKFSKILLIVLFVLIAVAIGLILKYTLYT
jgi:hypothetical protein